MDDSGNNALTAEQLEAQEDAARLRRLSCSAATESLPLLNSSYPIAILASDIHTAPIGAGAPAAAAGGAAAAAPPPSRDPKLVAHHMIFAMPERLMQKNDGMLNCLRGEGADGTFGAMFQRCYEFVLQSVASALQQLQNAEMANAGLARANAGVPAVRAFIECVVRDTPAAMPLQLPDALPLNGLSTKLNVEEHVLTFSPENILGYRLHVWIFDRTLHPARMFASQIKQNQAESELITDEVAIVRASLFRDPNNMDRAKASLHEMRKSAYRAKHPDADAEEIDEMVPAPTDAETHGAVERARRAPTPVQIKNARIQYQRSATELGFSVYDYQDMARFVHALYLSSTGASVPNNGTFVEPHVLADQSRPPGYRGHATEMAHYRIFNFENSVRLLQFQNDMAIMDPNQAKAEYYGLAQPGDRLSFPYPHLTWELPIDVLNPRMFVLYKAPWRQQSTFDVLARRYEKAIKRSQAIERRRMANEVAGGAGAGGTGRMSSHGNDLLSAKESMDDTSRLMLKHYMTAVDGTEERRQSSRFGYRRRTDDATVQNRRDLIARSKREFEAAVARRAAADASMDVDGSGGGGVDGALSVHNDSAQADTHVPYHEAVVDYKQMSTTGICFDRLFAVDKVTQDYSAVNISSTITNLREENAPLFDRVECILSQWPPLHALPPNGQERWTESLRATERDRCARELTDALFQETARRFVYRLSSMDKNMSDLFIGIMRKLQTEDPASFVQPAFVRMPDYTLSAQANASLLRDVGDAYNVRTLGTFAREAIVHMPADAVRPGHFVPTPHAVIGPPGSGKSLSTGIALSVFPVPNFGPVMHQSKLSNMGGDRNQSNQALVRDEMSSIMQNHSKENHEKRRDEVEQRKSMISLQAATFERLAKDQATGSITRSRVRIERQITEWELGNYMVAQLGAEMALADRYRWTYLMPRSHVGGQNEGIHAVYNFGQAQHENAKRMFVATRQRATCITALMAASSDCGVLPRCDTQVFGVMMAVGLKDIERFLPLFSQRGRLLLRGHTLAYGETLNTAHFKCMQSPASPYLMWDAETFNIIGVKPFRLETMRANLGTSLFCQPPDALNAMTMTFFEYYPMEAYFLAMSAATALCGFDSSKFSPLYQAANFLPDVVGRAREFLTPDQRGSVKPPVPDYILEMDRILEDMRFAARAAHRNGAVHDSANRGQDINPMFIVFDGNYTTFVYRLTALMQRYGRIDPPQVRSILDVLKHLQINAPVFKFLPRGTAVDPTTLAFECVDEEAGGSRQSNNVPHMRSAPQSGGLRDTFKGSEIVWRSYAALTIFHANGSASGGRTLLSAASALTGGQRGGSGGAGGSSNTSNAHENVATNDDGNTVKLLVHYLMLRPDHLYYLFSTAWMDRTTETVKTLVPIDVFDHPGVWHQVQMAPRYGVRLNMTNPNYQSDSSRLLLNSYDLSQLNQLLPGDHRALADVISQNIDVGARHPTISYRYSMVFDLWLKFLRENHLFPSTEEEAWVKERRDAVRAAPGEILKLVQLPGYLRERFLDLTDFEAWAALHRDRYLMPEHFIKVAQRTSPQLLAMLTAPIEIVDNLCYPDALIVGSECERYVHTIVRDKYKLRKRTNPKHQVSAKHCTRTLTEAENALLAQFRDGTVLVVNDGDEPEERPNNELGYLLQVADESEAERSFNMAEIIIQTCAVKAVLKHEPKLRTSGAMTALAAKKSSGKDDDDDDDAAAVAQEEKTRNQMIKMLADSLRCALAPRNKTEKLTGQSFLINATPALLRVHDRTRIMLYEYYLLRLVDLKKRACMRAAVLSTDMRDQLRYDRKLQVDNAAKNDAKIKAVVDANLTPLERLLLDDNRMRNYVLPSAPSSAKALLTSSASSLPAATAADPDAADANNIANSDEVTRRLRERVIGSVGFLYDRDEILVSESETDSRSRRRHRHHASTSSNGANGGSFAQRQGARRNDAAPPPGPVVIHVDPKALRRPGGFGFALSGPSSGDGSERPQPAAKRQALVAPPRSVDSEESDDGDAQSASSLGGHVTSTPLGSSASNSDADTAARRQHQKRTATTIVDGTSASVVLTVPKSMRQRIDVPLTPAPVSAQDTAMQAALARVRLNLPSTAAAAAAAASIKTGVSSSNSMRSSLNATTQSPRTFSITVGARHSSNNNNTSTGSLDADDERMQH